MGGCSCYVNEYYDYSVIFLKDILDPLYKSVIWLGIYGLQFRSLEKGSAKTLLRRQEMLSIAICPRILSFSMAFNVPKNSLL